MEKSVREAPLHIIVSASAPECIGHMCVHTCTPMHACWYMTMHMYAYRALNRER